MEFICPACHWHWGESMQGQSPKCPRCNLNPWEEPKMNRLTCGYWMWARPGNGSGAQCGKRVAISVGQTLAFCESHALGVLKLDLPTQQTLGVKHLA